jgi:DnaJ-class molecular chaperone
MAVRPAICSCESRCGRIHDFRRRGDDNLDVDLPITPSQAALGATVTEVPHLAARVDHLHRAQGPALPQCGLSR